MKLLNCSLAALLLLAVLVLRPDSYLSGALLVSALLAILTLNPKFRVSVMTGVATLNMILMFYFFYRFFSVVPTLEANWFVHSTHVDSWLALLGGFASMHVLADNSCCLKREFEAPAEAGLTRLIRNYRERHQQTLA